MTATYRGPWRLWRLTVRVGPWLLVAAPRIGPRGRRRVWRLLKCCQHQTLPTPPDQENRS